MGRSRTGVLAVLAALSCIAAPGAQDAPARPEPGARRLQVLFLGAPTANGPHHDPITRYRTLKKGLGVDGIDLTYVEDPAQAFTPEALAPFDAVLLYGNWAQMGTLPEPQLQALLGFVENGGGFVPVHCASACWGRSPRFVRLVGGRFQSHGGEEFSVANVAKDHPVLQGLDGFTAWDETYVHDEHGDDRTILQTRNGEPWTWVRTQGKGRVFYTAAGHDHRVWDLPAYQQLLRRGLLWAAGDAALARLQALQLPQLEQETVSLPGYRERKEITRAQKPLSAAESQKLAMVPVGWQLQLFASEPDIVNPIHVAWDHRGRAFVTETVDYPNNLQSGDLGHDRITICEDTDGDGKADRFTRFAEKLSIPTSLAFANGGVVCTNGADILFLADTDGDDKADVRKVLFTGFHMGDTHAGISNLRPHHDGWIWATIGYSGFHGEVGGQRHEFAQGVLRFRADGSAVEFVQNTTNNTWGLGVTAAGHVVGSTANGNPSFFVTFAQSAYRAVGIEPPVTPRADDDPPFFPMSTDIRQVDFFDRYTAAAGHAVCTGDRLPAAWHDRVAFVCEPTGKLVAAFELARDGASFVARQTANPVFASADAWTSPVCAEVGPDGALWICDWYNLIVQHNPTPTKSSAGVAAKTGRGNAYETPLRDTRMGRIWRTFPRAAKPTPAPTLGDTKALVAALDHPHLAWRLHAQRLLTERRDQAAVPGLRERLQQGGTAAPHALEVLQALGATTGAELEAALRSPHEPTVARALAHADVAAIKRAFVVDATFRGAGRMLADALVRLAGSAADPELGQALVQLGRTREREVFDDPTLRDAWSIAARRHTDTVLAAAEAQGLLQTTKAPPPNLLPNPAFTELDGAVVRGWNDLRVYGGARAPDVQAGPSPDGRDASPCLRIATARTSDCGIAAVVKVQKATRYRLAGWIRTENVEPRAGEGAMLNVHGGVRTAGVQGTTDWTRVSAEFDTGNDDEIVVHCLFGGYGGASGTAWFDDVSLEPIGSSQTLAGALEGLATFRRAAQSPAAPKARTFAIDADVHARGAAVFARTCIACHGVDGKGLAAQFPPLDGSDWVTGEKHRPIDIVLHGLIGPIQVGDVKFDTAMPPLGFVLGDAEIADVLTYVRQRWSNDAAPVTAADVAARRKANAERTSMWTADELRK
ncbi:MAG: ThuA domain-containing protein [Planctomycetes bacterium]|nr:ThuA domain-containing protein [Planctomycetota bacterium]